MAATWQRRRVHDPIDPTTVPARIRAEAFNTALVEVTAYLIEAGYSLDPIAQLELVDAELRRIALGREGPVAMVH